MTESAMEFEAFPKIARLSRDIMITEKIDGTNAQIAITPFVGAISETDAICGVTIGSANYAVYAGSRSRWLHCGKDRDNFGFASWVQAHAIALVDGLGEGRHFGEWWGPGIQRGYGLKEKRFSLFNVKRWQINGPPPACCSIVPLLYRGPFDLMAIDSALATLGVGGSLASPGFMRPEGIIVYHTASNTLFKKTLEGDDEPKSARAASAE